MVSGLIVCAGIAGFFHLACRVWLIWGFGKENPKSSHYSSTLPPLSVVVAARNEEANLLAFLPSILEQHYSEFELIVALDRCEDRSFDVLSDFSKKYPQLRVVEIEEKPDHWAGKKWALSQAIAEARNEYLVFTDADCEVEKSWLLSYGKAFASGADLVLGLGLYRSYPGMLNRFIRYETVHTAFQYFGAAGQGRTYMGVGRNMGYHRSLYDEQSGFAAFRKSLSGDDDILINRSTSSPQTVCLEKAGSRTWSEPERSIGSWLRQKGRHFSASARYTVFSKLALGIFHGSQIAFYFFLGLCLLSGGHIGVGLFVYIAYLLGSWYIFGLFAKEIHQNTLVLWYPLLDMAYACYHSLIAPFGLLVRPSWQTNQNRKSRKTPSKTASS
jgi:glycosyltransferase involved in cell wall biosynthesis